MVCVTGSLGYLRTFRVVFGAGAGAGTAGSPFTSTTLGRHTAPVVRLGRSVAGNWPFLRAAAGAGQRRRPTRWERADRRPWE